jgi:hypothetical protein
MRVLLDLPGRDSNGGLESHRPPCTYSVCGLSLGLSLLLLSGMAVQPASTFAATVANPIRTENNHAGTGAWNVPIARNREVEAYASEASVLPGQRIHFHVSTNPARSYRLQIYRLGWYHGKGGRLVACIPSCTRTRMGKSEPIPLPDSSGKIDAQWPTTDSLNVRRRWVSGYYLAVARLSSRIGYPVPFVVRSTRPSRILVQAAVNTWQAYNNWGGKSLYAFNSQGAPAVKVSFNRPYSVAAQGNGPLVWEYPLVRFLERRGYDVSYTTDVDTDAAPNLVEHKLVISAGHDEYWTKGMRDAFDSARDRGINLMFLGADVAEWQVRLEERARTLVAYRSATLDPSPDAPSKTTRFRQLQPPRPECALVGNWYRPGSVTAKNRAYSVASAALSDPWFAGTGFASGDVIPGIVGYEWSGVEPGCVANPVTVFFHMSDPVRPADAVRYIASSGAHVFSSGTVSWSWSLDSFGGHTVDARLQRFMRNALDSLSR